MKRRNNNKGGAALMLLDAVATIAMLLLALQLVDYYTTDITELEQLNYAEGLSFAIALFFTLAAAELIRIFTRRDHTRFSTVRHIAGIVFFTASGVLLILRGGDYISAYVACTVYAALLVFGRVERIVRDHRTRNIVSNVFLILIIVLLLVLPTNIIFVPILVVIQTLVHIGNMAFAQINYKVLEKIIRKTYVIEFVFGMLLLIVAFSIVLQRTEASIETFMDGLWYCFAIVTTIGFGDYTAVGLVGRFLSVILGIYGIIVVALITSVIVNFYNEVKDEPDDAPPPPEEAMKEEKMP